MVFRAFFKSENLNFTTNSRKLSVQLQLIKFVAKSSNDIETALLRHGHRSRAARKITRIIRQKVVKLDS